MRSKLLIITAAGTAVSVAVLILTAIAIAVDSTGTAIAGALIGTAGIIFSAVVGATVIRRRAAQSDARATQVRNLERRVQGLRDLLDEVSRRADEAEHAAARREEEARVRAAETADALDGIRGRAVDDRATIAKLQAGAKRSSAAVEKTADKLAAVNRDVRTLRKRVPPGSIAAVNTRIDDLSARVDGDADRLAARSDELEAKMRKYALRTASGLRIAFESAIRRGQPASSVLSNQDAEFLFNSYVKRGEFVHLKPLIESFDVHSKQNLTTLRTIYRNLRVAGYWVLAEEILALVAQKTARENDMIAAVKIGSEIATYRVPDTSELELPSATAYDPNGPIIHMVGRVLPETQSGYTLRTHYTADAQRRAGLDVVVVGQSGILESGSEEGAAYVHEGLDYRVLAGGSRSALPLLEWLEANIRSLSDLVAELRPSILHAHSDFINALLVLAVGRRYGIPVVYESRGFWEESWLSRTITKLKWGADADSLFEAYGLPDAYALRKSAEEAVRSSADHVFTLAEVMCDHMLESQPDDLNPDNITIVPNAVDASNFPVLSPDTDLRRELGLPEDAVVVGYISSMVEYEGVEVLLDAYNLAAKGSSRPLCLLLVGDGDYLGVLKKHAEAIGVRDVFMTGRVPHEHVLRYYSLIDVFVVPRKPAKVSELVTPLKPFEAFSTGRCVILSDVAALKEIADQSGAVLTFRAGDAAHLSQRIVELVENEEMRAAMGRRAAAWVRNYRSWDRNVAEYYRAYRRLGYTGTSSANLDADLQLRDRGVNVSELRERLIESPLPPLRGWFTIQDVRQDGHSLLKDGWKFASFEPVNVVGLRDWAVYGQTHRSWGFHLHAWECIDPLLADFDETGDARWLRAAVDIAVNWVDVNLKASDDDDPMIWYDMSLALRAPRLLALLYRVARSEEYREQFTILAAAFLRHVEELQADRAYNPRNNHGFYAAAAQVHLAKYAVAFPGMVETGKQGAGRMSEMAELQFAPDGVHLEHSPDYHRMLLNSFELALKDGLLEDPDVASRIRKAAHVLGWMIQPNGCLVQFGDSPETKMTGKGRSSIDENTQFILSDGQSGRPADQEMAIFAKGGYAFVRSPQPAHSGELANSGYLAFSAAFHSRAHKHADDLNVVWYDRGQEILVDAGRFGYGDLLASDDPARKEGFYYAAPERQFVEGTMAHNTVMVGGRNQERRAREPYGSAIGECTSDEGVFDLVGRVQHEDYIHRRRVVYRPGAELLLKDSLFSQTEIVRDAVVWLNIAGHFELESVGDEVVFISNAGGRRVKLQIAGPGSVIEPVKGQHEPLRGWRSRRDRELEPTWSVGFTVPLETRVSVDTRLRLS